MLLRKVDIRQLVLDGNLAVGKAREGTEKDNPQSIQELTDVYGSISPYVRRRTLFLYRRHIVHASTTKLLCGI